MESNKDIIYYAALALEKGEWQICYELLLQINIWTSIMNKDQVKERIKNKVKESALKCYLLRFKSILENISLSLLEKHF